MKPLLTLFALCCLLPALCLGQWQPDVRLTNNSYESDNPYISVSGSNVHVVWMDERDGNWEIYYKHSADNGLNWGEDIRLTNYLGESGNPSISVSGSNVHVVWMDERDGNWEIYYKRSADNGSNWGEDIRLTNNSFLSYFPSISISGSYVHVSWQDYRDGNWEIYYKRSADNGSNWGGDVRLTNNSAWSWFPLISVSGSYVHVVWGDTRDGNFEIYYKRSADNGSNWGGDVRLTNDTAFSSSHSISVSGSNVHVVWIDERDGNSEIYYKRSADNGSNWGGDVRLTNNSAQSWNPSISVSGSYVHVSWQDYRDGNSEVYYKQDPTGNAIGILPISSQVSKEFKLHQNYPNPFNPVTSILFDVPHSSQVKLTLFNALGQELIELVNDELKPGSYRYGFNAENLPSGVYFYRMMAGEYSETRKMVLIK